MPLTWQYVPHSSTSLTKPSCGHHLLGRGWSFERRACTYQVVCICSTQTQWASATTVRYAVSIMGHDGASNPTKTHYGTYMPLTRVNNQSSKQSQLNEAFTELVICCSTYPTMVCCLAQLLVWHSVLHPNSSVTPPISYHMTPANSFKACIRARNHCKLVHQPALLMCCSIHADWAPTASCFHVFCHSTTYHTCIIPLFHWTLLQPLQPCVCLLPWHYQLVAWRAGTCNAYYFKYNWLGHTYHHPQCQVKLVVLLLNSQGMLPDSVCCVVLCMSHVPEQVYTWWPAGHSQHLVAVLWPYHLERLAPKAHLTNYTRIDCPMRHEHAVTDLYLMNGVIASRIMRLGMLESLTLLMACIHNLWVYHCYMHATKAYPPVCIRAAAAHSIGYYAERFKIYHALWTKNEVHCWKLHARNHVDTKLMEDPTSTFGCRDNAQIIWTLLWAQHLIGSTGQTVWLPQIPTMDSYHCDNSIATVTHKPCVKYTPWCLIMAF